MFYKKINLEVDVSSCVGWSKPVLKELERTVKRKVLEYRKDHKLKAKDIEYSTVYTAHIEIKLKDRDHDCELDFFAELERQRKLEEE